MSAGLPTTTTTASMQDLAEQVKEAKAAIVAVLTSEPDKDWSPRALVDEAKDGRRNTVMSIAFWGLVEDGVLIVDNKLLVRPADRASR